MSVPLLLTSPLEQFDLFLCLGIPNYLVSSAVVVILTAYTYRVYVSSTLLPSYLVGALESKYRLLGTMLCRSIMQSNTSYYLHILSTLLLVVVINVAGLTPYSFTYTSQLVLNLYVSATLCL